MHIYDLSVALSDDVPTYPGDPGIKISQWFTLAGGDPANVSLLHFGAHTGTHVDAPNHFIEGARRLDALDLEKLIGRCVVVEVNGTVAAIEPEHLPLMKGVERVLFKTRNSAFWNDTTRGFREDFTYISADAARALAENDVKLVGIDYLSVEKFGSTDFATHITLLEKEIIILEGLDLREVPPGEYEITCLPLKYIGGTGDGAPARTILRPRSA